MSTHRLNLSRDKEGFVNKVIAACKLKTLDWQEFTMAYNDQGWEFSQIHRIDKDIEDALRLAEKLLPWMWAASYERGICETDAEDFFAFYQDKDTLDWQKDLLAKCIGALDDGPLTPKYASHESGKANVEWAQFETSCKSIFKTSVLEERGDKVSNLCSETNTDLWSKDALLQDSPVWEAR